MFFYILFLSLNLGNNTFLMPGNKVEISAIFTKIPAETPTPALPFTDVPADNWYCDAVQYVYARTLMTGTSPDTFSPAAPMTRSMVWTVLARMSGADTGGGTPWYAKAQTWAVSAGVSDGASPDGSITREQLAAMLYRQAGSPAAAADLDVFADNALVSDWALPAVQWAVCIGLLQGDGARLDPVAPASRAEVAALLMRFCESASK